MFKFRKDINVDNEFDITQIEFGVHATTTDELVEEFYHFMLACGFRRESILTSFSAKLGEEKFEE